MPRISAPTVAEHHANIEAQLIAAAEEFLRANPRARLTAGEVSERVGIARNSIYRYVESVDDLAGLVIARHLPTWVEAVDQAVSEAGPDPIDRLVAWTRANIDEAVRTGHAWLMEAARAQPSRSSDEAARTAHAALRDRLIALWEELPVGSTQRAAAAAAITNGIVESGFHLLESSAPPRLVVDLACQAVRGLAREMKAGAPA